jgi:hypothetical protein
MIHQLEHCDTRKEHVNSSNWNMFMYDTDPKDELDALRIYGQLTGTAAEEFANAVNPSEA